MSQMITWNDVLPGDVVRGEDGLEWFVFGRDLRGTVVLLRAGSEPQQGHPPATAGVELRYRGQLGTALHLLRTELAGEVISHG